MRTQRSGSLTGYAVSTLALTVMVVMSPLAAPGDVDITFGPDGTLTTDFFGSFDQANAVVVDRSGRILVAGYAGSGSGPYFTVVRYESDGTIDSAFGTGGAVFTPFESPYGSAYAIAVDAAERIVVVGSNLVSTRERMVAARYLEDGSLDETFDGDGVVRVFPTNWGRAHAVALDVSGRIVVAGRIEYGGAGNPGAMGVARLNADGSADATFGVDGTVITSLGGAIAYGYGVALDGQGRIVVAGRGSVGPGLDGSGFAVARYHADGSLDTSFGGNGVITNNFGGRGAIGRAVAIDTRGRIVVAGGVYEDTFGSMDFGLARYRPDGALDTGFGDGGTSITELGGNDQGRGVVLDASDRIVLAGSTTTEEPGRLSAVEHFAVARYSVDGWPDRTFGHGGWVRTSFGWFGGGANAVALDRTGRIVAVGEATRASAYDDWAIARYSSEGYDPSPSPPIDIKPADAGNDISLEARGKVLVAVLSTPGFDAPQETRAASLTFGRTGDEQSLLVHKDGAPQCAWSDVNHDGRLDLVCEFLVKLAGFRLGDLEGIVHGFTEYGVPIVARDRVHVVP